MHEAPARPLRSIGVGYDGTPESEAALILAHSIANSSDASLHLCGVVDDRIPPIGWSALARGGAAVPRWEEAVLAEVASLRELAQSAIRVTGRDAQVDVVRGRPADALVCLSAELDLLVIGSRRWGPAARLLLGSTGEALAHDAVCPLLIAPRPNR
jgi:nucleotide-binding universal stress UspA family protein